MLRQGVYLFAVLTYLSCSSLSDFHVGLDGENTIQFDSSDTIAPDPGNSGILNFTLFSDNSITVAWTAATDNVTAQSGLQYQVYYSLTNNIETLSNTLASGTAFGSYTAAAVSRTVTGLLYNTPYYFTVLVKDQNNRITNYAMSNFQIVTLAPVPGASGAMSMGGTTSNSIEITWTKATDDYTPQANIQYLLYFSPANNISTVPTILANGTVVGSFAANITNKTAAGLSANTTYYMNLLILDGNNNTNCYTSGAFIITNSPPVAGSSGTLSLGSAGTNFITLNWVLATDDFTAQANLQYLVYFSTQNNIGTVPNTLANGTPVGSYAANINTKTITGLTPATTYYFNVLVKDDTGIVGDYSTAGFSTTQAPPIAGNSGLITLGTISNTSIVINWTKANDDVSLQNTLEYLVYYSPANNITSVANILANGTPADSYMTDINSKAVTNLIPGTTYYFNILVKDQAGLVSNYSVTSYTTTNLPPVPGGSGVITPGTVGAGSITINWTKAVDDSSAQSNLQYQVYYSSSDNITNLASVLANGLPVGSLTTNINTKTISNLTLSTTYYFNVIVRDESGYNACYNSLAQATTSDTTAPTPGGPIVLSAFSVSGMTLTWTKATDDYCPQAQLQYLAYYSLSNNITNVADAEVNGTPIGGYQTDIQTVNASGLTMGKHYYFTVIVKDQYNNKAVYTTADDWTELEWLFSTNGNLEGWANQHNTILTVAGGILTVTITNTDPYFRSPVNLNFEGSKLKKVVFSLKNNTVDGAVQVYFDILPIEGMDGTKVVGQAISTNDSGFNLYTRTMSGNAKWNTNIINVFRLDPGSGNGPSMEFDYIKVTH